MKKERVAIFIDGSNLYYSLKNLKDGRIDFKKLRQLLTKTKMLISTFYYNAPLKENFNKYVYWNQMKLFSRLRKIPRCKVVLCKRQKRVDRDEKEYYVIKGDDIHLSLDMLRDACKDKYDKAILISGDGDFTQLVNYVRKEDKEVNVYAFKKLTSVDLINKANKHFWIDKKMVNKMFLRRKGN